MYLAQLWEKSIDILSGYAEDRSGAFSKKKKTEKFFTLDVWILLIFWLDRHSNLHQDRATSTDTNVTGRKDFAT